MAVTLRNKTYDKLKHVTQVVLPAVGSLYFGLSAIWGLPAGEEVVGTLALLTTFGGVTLLVSTKNYNPDIPESNPNFAGDFIVDTTPEGKKVVQLALARDPRDIVDNEALVFRAVDTSKEEQNEQFWDNPAE